MTIYNLYIFDRQGNCLYYVDWNRTKPGGMKKDEEFKLMYGMLFSMRSFTSRISPIDQREGFLNFKTNKYKLNYYETPSGIKIVMNTDLGVENIKDILHSIYSQIYVEYVVKNNLCELDKPITSELFQTKLDEYVRNLPIFATKIS